MKFHSAALFLVCSLVISSCNKPQPATESAEVSQSETTTQQTDPETKAMSQEEMIKSGERLVIITGCDDCHSPKKMTDKGPVPEEGTRLSGHPANLALAPYDQATVKAGWSMTNPHFTAWVGPWGVSFSANLTPDTTTGIGAWKEEHFMRAIKEGKFHGLPAGRMLLPPMPWPNYSHMTDEELRSVFAYLKSIKPVKNAVPAPIPPKGA
jgi:cytochrome c553